MICATALLALIGAGCATTSTSTQDVANMLVASGFKTITPRTPEQQPRLQQIQVGQVAEIQKRAEPTSLSRPRLGMWSMWVGLRSTRIINKCALKASLRRKISRPLRCIRTHQCSGIQGVAGA